jgi:hypothetical protein
MEDRRSSLAGGGNLLMPLLALATLIGFSTLYMINGAQYTRMMAMWSFTMTSRPFIDAEWIITEIRLFGRGIDVYAAPPGNPPGGPFDYSPLWL